MNIIFLVSLILLTYYAYRISGRDLLSPWVILCAVFLGVLIIVLLNSYKWEVVFYEYPVFLIILALVMWGIGGGFASLSTSRTKQITSLCYRKRMEGYYPAGLICVISICCSIMYIIKHLYGIDFSAGITAGIRQIYERALHEQGGNFLKNQMFQIVVALSYLSIYRIMVKVFILKRDIISYIPLLIPVVNFLMVTLLSTDRNIFLRACIYTSALWIVFFRQKAGRKGNTRIIKKLCIIFVIVLVAFYGLGKVKQYKSSFLNSLSIYGGSGLYNLNLYIHEHPTGKLNVGDSSMFFSIRNMLARLGLTSESNFVRFDEFISIETKTGYIYRSNVYTALKTYYYDYGIWGMIIVPFISGMFYEWFYRRINQKKLGFSCVLYAALIYPVLYYPILEQMFNRIHFGLIYELFWLTSVFHFVYGRSGVWRVRTVRKRVKNPFAEIAYIPQEVISQKQEC